jgi:hypothetical protein
MSFPFKDPFIMPHIHPGMNEYARLVDSIEDEALKARFKAWSRKYFMVLTAKCARSDGGAPTICNYTDLPEEGVKHVTEHLLSTAGGDGLVHEGPEVEYWYVSSRPRNHLQKIKGP